MSDCSSVSPRSRSAAGAPCCSRSSRATAPATKLLVEEGETGVELAAEADEVIRGARNTLLELPGRKVFGEVYMPPPRLFVYGAVDTAEALCKAAKLLGWTTDRRRRARARSRPPSGSRAPTS